MIVESFFCLKFGLGNLGNLLTHQHHKPQPSPINNPPVAINNQPCNNDLISFSIHVIFICIVFTFYGHI